MTITDLIEKLTELRAEHGDLLVLVDGYEEDMDAARSPRPVDVFDKGEDVKKCEWWSGQIITPSRTALMVPPWWGQRAENALNTPSSGWVTT